MVKTRLSSKGQVIIPKAVRATHGWEPGTEFAIEDRDEGIVLRPLRLFPASALREVIVVQGIRTRDLGGSANTTEFTEAVVKAIEAG